MVDVLRICLCMLIIFNVYEKNRKTFVPLNSSYVLIKLPYFEKIKKNYNSLKKKLHIKNFNLDISAVSFKPQTYVSSPTSVNLSKDFII